MPTAASTPEPGLVGGVVGIVLAAGAGRRMGGPKALVGPLADSGRTPLAQVCSWLREAGCPRVIAVIGAQADAVRAALAADPWPAPRALPAPSSPDADRTLPANSSSSAHGAPLDVLIGHSDAESGDRQANGAHWPSWLEVVEASDWEEGMGASLRAALRAASETDADATLITLVDLPDVRTPVYARLLGSVRPSPDALARAAFTGTPGHPVLIGRRHWPAVADVAVGDQGARALFRATPHTTVECGDLASGQDADTPITP